MLITVCAATCDYTLLQQALDAAAPGDTVEVQGGVHEGPFLVPHDLTVRGVGATFLVGSEPEVPVLSVADGVSAALESLVIDGQFVNAGIAVGAGASLVVRASTLLQGFSFGDGACLLAEGAAAVELVDTSVLDCTGQTSAMRVAAPSVVLTRVRLAGNSTPTLVVDGADEVVLHDVVADGNGWLWTAGPAIDLVGARSVEVLRSWFCTNLGDGVGALRFEGGCDGDCTVDHAVLQLNGGGGLSWSGAAGTVRHTTFAGNTAFTGGAQVSVTGGSLSLDHLLVVDGGLPGERPAFSSAAAGTLEVTDSTIAAAEPGVPTMSQGNDPGEPAFARGWVTPACGLPIVLDPGDPLNAALSAWPGDGGRGALTTDDCGPWCADLDGDGSPAMWDCAEDDPTHSHLTEEIVDDGIDQDCDGFDACWLDFDGDGFGSITVPKLPTGECGPPLYAEVAGDCDDEDWTISPDADERPADETDADCDGFELCFLDADGDGFSGALTGPSDALDCAADGVAPTDEGDCDDADPDVWPVDGDCVDRNRDEDDAGGCGCASVGGSGAGWIGVALLLGLRRRAVWFRGETGCGTGSR